MSRVIILRPQPGADATADRAQALGLEPVIYPLFTVEPLAWEPPDRARFDALMLTSANAVRHAGPELTRFAALPIYVVGKATASAACDFGLAPHHIGDTDAADLLEAMHREGRRAVLHLCGENVVDSGASGLDIQLIPVYRSIEHDSDDDLIAALQPYDILLIHSPRAGKRLNALVGSESRSGLSVIAISQAALDAAGDGWTAAQAAPLPTDTAMLALALELCHKSCD
ncbi:MAG: uroporphyrinogen-III synthase [Sphingomonadaceae bacterium]|jgi:uroporphyrinogen-III synthase